MGLGHGETKNLYFHMFPEGFWYIGKFLLKKKKLEDFYVRQRQNPPFTFTFQWATTAGAGAGPGCIQEVVIPSRFPCGCRGPNTAVFLHIHRESNQKWSSQYSAILAVQYGMLASQVVA